MTRKRSRNEKSPQVWRKLQKPVTDLTDRTMTIDPSQSPTSSMTNRELRTKQRNDRSSQNKTPTSSTTQGVKETKNKTKKRLAVRQVQHSSSESKEEEERLHSTDLGGVDQSNSMMMVVYQGGQTSTQQQDSSCEFTTPTETTPETKRKKQSEGTRRSPRYINKSKPVHTEPRTEPKERGVTEKHKQKGKRKKSPTEPEVSRQKKQKKEDKYTEMVSRKGKKQQKDTKMVSKIDKMEKKDSGKLSKQELNVKKGITEARNDNPRLLCRKSPRTLVRMFAEEQNFSAAQRQAVIDMRFGALLAWRIEDLPGRLGLYVAKKFDECKCTIKLKGSTEILVTENDVHDYLGIPNGNIRIEAPDKLRNKEILAKLADDFPKKTMRTIVLGNIKDKMLTYQGDIWFKRYFILFFVNSVVDGHANGKLKYEILDLLDHIDKISQYNWSAFVFDKLVECASNWEPSTTKPYTGPLLLLLLIYVDQMVFKGKPSERKFPIIKNWNTKTLKEREDEELIHSEFGRGFVRKRPQFHDQDESTRQEETDSAQDKQNDTAPNDDELKTFMKSYLQDAEEMVVKIRKFVNKNKGTPQQLAHNGLLNKVNIGCENILNVKLRSESLSQTEDDDFDNQSEFWDEAVKCLDEIDKTLKEKEKHEGSMWIPGLSDFVQQVSRDYGETMDEENMHGTHTIGSDDDREERENMEEPHTYAENMEEARRVEKGEEIIHDKEKENKEEHNQINIHEPHNEEEVIEEGNTNDKEEHDQNQFKDPSEILGQIIEEQDKESSGEKHVGSSSEMQDQINEEGDKEASGDKVVESPREMPSQVIEEAQIIEEAPEREREDGKAGEEKTTKNTKITMHFHEVPSFDLGFSPISTQEKEILRKLESKESTLVEATESTIPKKNVQKMITNPSEYVKSPFKAREVDINEHATTEEKNIYDWLMNTRIKNCDVIFKLNEFSSYKSDFSSIREGQCLDSGLFNGFTAILNENEIYKDAASPLRFFIP